MADQPTSTLQRPAGTGNFAPLQPLLAIQGGNPRAESTLGRAIRERFEHHYNLERKIRESMIAVGYQNSMFIEGKQFNPSSPTLTNSTKCAIFICPLKTIRRVR